MPQYKLTVKKEIKEVYEIWADNEDEAIERFESEEDMEPEETIDLGFYEVVSVGKTI